MITTTPLPAGLNFIALGIGLTLASQLNALYMDKIYIYLKAQNKKNGGDGAGEPEYRVPSMIIGSIVLPVGLLMTGWAAERGVSWVVTDVVGGLLYSFPFTLFVFELLVLIMICLAGSFG